MNFPRHEDLNYGLQAEFLKKVREFGTAGAGAALETLDAAMLLLAWGKVPQALVMLHQTIEVALKALLEEVHVLLVLQEMNFELAKGLAKDHLQKHRLGRRITNFIDPETFDPQRTCQFMDAYRRASQLIEFKSVDVKTVDRINKLRNAIAHYGGKPEESFNYLDVILNGALPWLTEFYREAYGGELSHYLFGPCYRELVVAGEYLGRCKQSQDLPRGRILSPFAHRFLLESIVGSGRLLFDSEGSMRDTSEWKMENLEADFQHYEMKWSEFRVVGEVGQLDCVICGQSCIVALEEPRKVDGETIYHPVAIHCPNCGLHLDPDYSELVQLHYGSITRERCGESNWEQIRNDFGDA